MNLKNRLISLKFELTVDNLFNFKKINIKNNMNFVERKDQFIKWYKEEILKNDESYTNDIDKLIDELTLFFEDIGNSNIHSYLNSLKDCEKEILKIPKYPKILWLNKNDNTYFKVSNKGIVIEEPLSDDLFSLSFQYRNTYKNSNIRDVYIDLYKRNFKFNKTCDIKEQIISYDKRMYLRDEFIKCVIYNIINRNINDNGIKNATTLAQLFEIDINSIIESYKVTQKVKSLKE